MANLELYPIRHVRAPATLRSYSREEVKTCCTSCELQKNSSRPQPTQSAVGAAHLLKRKIQPETAQQEAGKDPSRAEPRLLGSAELAALEGNEITHRIRQLWREGIEAERLRDEKRRKKRQSKDWPLHGVRSRGIACQFDGCAGTPPAGNCKPVPPTD